MIRTSWLSYIWALALCLPLGAAEPVPVLATREVEPEDSPSVAGSARGLQVELAYAGVARARKARRMAEVFAELPLDSVTHAPAEASWGRMQRSPRSSIDFDRLDTFVEAYQGAGFDHLLVILDAAPARDADAWLPPQEHLDAYAAWVTAVVERYDGDGVDDAPGLRHPVLRYQVGRRFAGGAEAGDYLRTLTAASQAARTACEDVTLLHAGFFVTPAFVARPSGLPAVEAAFSAAASVLPQGLAALRQVLDRPELFDQVNLEAGGDPYEIEGIAAWIRAETAARGYEKPLVLGHTTTSPFLAWGKATQGRGVIVPPAARTDRPRLAAYFTRLTQGEEALVAAVHRFAAGDLVKKILVSAEQDVARIRLAGMQDQEAYTKPAGQAAAGNAAWGGMVDPAGKQRRPAFFALDQVLLFLRGYDEVVRLPAQDERVCVYEVREGEERRWVAWAEPSELVLPGGDAPRIELDLPVDASHLMVERLATGPHPARTARPTRKGAATVTLTRSPAFLFTRF